VVLEGSAVGVERRGGSLAVSDQGLEALLPEIEQVADLVQCGEFAAGPVGLGAVLDLLEHRALGCGLRLAVRRHRADVTVMVAELGLGLVLDRLAPVVGLR
jgi:hypothetical protein